MPRSCKPVSCSHPLPRRTFLNASLAVGAATFVGAATLSDVALAGPMTKAQRDKLTPDDVLALMKKGNKRFSAGRRLDHNYLAQQRASAAGQYPVAVLLSCIDSRAPAETIMDLRIGDIFNSRIAGNVESVDVMGGMEFACKVTGSKLVLVMGHTACGAIKGAIDNAELGNLTELLAKIKPAVAATKFDGERSSKNPAFVDAVTATHVRLTVSGIRQNSKVLAALEQEGKIKIVGSMYHLVGGSVEMLS